jgi:hypothetical protein
MVMTEAELIEFGYIKRSQAKKEDAPYCRPETSTPLLSLAWFDPDLNALVINADQLEARGGNLEAVKHELLHAHAYQEKGLKGKASRVGIRSWQTLPDGRVSLADEGFDEGLTEYFRQQTGKIARLNLTHYQPIVSAIEILAKQIPDSLFYDAYFKGQRQPLILALERLHGKEAYAQFGVLADFLLDSLRRIGSNSYQRASGDLIGFASYGFEQRMMDHWGYTPETFSRGPKYIPTASLPLPLSEAIIQKNVLAYSNLTPAEQNHLLANTDLTSLARRITLEANPTGRRTVLCFIHYKYRDGVSLNFIQLNSYEERFIGTPHFLGRDFSQTEFSRTPAA